MGTDATDAAKPLSRELINCPFPGCTAIVRKDRAERHLLRAHPGDPDTKDFTCPVCQRVLLGLDLWPHVGDRHPWLLKSRDFWEAHRLLPYAPRKTPKRQPFDWSVYEGGPGPSVRALPGGLVNPR